MDQNAEAKLQELRNKTNRQLASLISHKLDRGLAYARVLEGEGRSDWASTEHFAVHAEKAFADASLWMTMLKGGPALERRRLEFKLSQLRFALDRTLASQERVVQAAC